MRSNSNGSIKRDKCFGGYVCVRTRMRVCVRTRMRVYVCSRTHTFWVGKVIWDEAGK